jgi:hypothetical protein
MSQSACCKARRQSHTDTKYVVYRTRNPGRYPSLTITGNERTTVICRDEPTYRVNKMFTKRSQPQPETKAAGGKIMATY